MKKVLKRTLSMVLVFTMLITTFCFFDIGILKSKAWLNVSELEASEGRPEVTVSVPETIYLKYNTQTFQYYVDRTEGGALSTDPAKTTGNISFVSSLVCSSISVAASAASGSVSGVTYTNGSSATNSTVFKTAVNGGTASGGTVIKWTFTYKIDSITYNSYAFTYVYAPAADNVIGSGFAGHVKGTTHNGYSSYLGLTAGLHSIAASSNGTYGFNLKNQDATHTAPLDIAVGTNSGNLSSIPKANGRNSDGNSTVGNLSSAGIMTSKSNGGVFWYELGNGEKEGVTMTGYIPQGGITVDTSRYSNLNQIPNLQAVGYFTYLEWADPVKCTFYTGTGSYSNATNQFAASGDYESDNGDGKNHYFSARINQAISGSTSVFVKQYSQYKYNGTFDNWYIEVYLWNQINVTAVNKATLRKEYEAACNKALRSDNETSSNATVSAYLSALQTAGANLGNPASTTTDTSTLTTKAAAVDTLMTSSGHVVEPTRATPEIFFYVPETIYLKPNANTFQYYLDRGNSDKSAINKGYSTQGNVYFHCAGATNVSIVFSSTTATSASVTTNAALSGTDKIDTYIKSGSATVTSGECSSLRWDATFTVNGKTYTATAFSVIYAPFTKVVAGIASARQPSGTFSHSCTATQASWISGIHSITNNRPSNYTSGTNAGSDHRGTYEYPYMTTNFSSSSGDDDDPYILDDSGAIVGASYFYKSNDTATCWGGEGLLHVDTSRYDTYSQIPNLVIGCDVTHYSSYATPDGYTYTYALASSLQVKNADDSGVTNGTKWQNSTSRPSKGRMTTTIANTVKINTAYTYLSALTRVHAKGSNSRTAYAGSFLKFDYQDRSGLREALNKEVSMDRQSDWYTSDSWTTYMNTITNAYSELGNPLAVNAANTKKAVEEAPSKLVLRSGKATALHQSKANPSIVLGRESEEYDFGATVTAGNNVYDGYTYEGVHSIINLEEWYKTVSKNSSSGSTASYANGVVTFTNNNTSGGEVTTSHGEGSLYYAVPIEPNTTYVIQFTAKKTGSGTASGEVFFFPYAATGSWLAAPSKSCSSDGTYSFECTTGATAQTAQFRFDVNGPSTTWQYSNLIIYKKSGTDTVITSATKDHTDWTFFYTPNTYNVTYNLDGGTFNGSTNSASNTATYDANYSVGSSINATAPTKTGYVFTGWSCSADGATYTHGQAITPWKFATDVVFTATWRPNTYTVYYVPNDSNVTPTANQLIGTGLTLDDDIDTATDTFTKIGYSVSAWSTKQDSCILEGDNQNAVPAGTRITVYNIAEAQGQLEHDGATLYLYANYAQSMVFFDVNHDSVGVNVFAPKFKTTTSNGLTLSYNESTGVFTLNGTQTGSSADFLYSAFTPQEGDTYTFSITQVGGSKTAGNGCVVLEPSKGETNTNLTNRKNCDFNGTTAKTFTFNSTDVAECKNLRFWVWQNSTANVFNNFQFKIKVEKKSSKTEYSPDGRQISGDTYGTLPADPTRTGYTFAGWYDSATGGNQITASSAYVSATNHTLYAHWTKDTFNLKYNENKPSTAVSTTSVSGMPSPNPQTLTYDTASTVSSATPTLTGYTFAGWATSTTGSVAYAKSAALSASTVNSMYQTSGVGKGGTYNLYAKWTPNTNTAYKVQVYVMGTNGSYPTTVTYTFNASGTTDATVIINSGNFATFAKNSTTGITDANISQFSLDSTHAGSVLTGPVKNDGSSVFVIYVKRASHTLTLDAATNGGSVSPTSVTLYYGQTYTLPTATKSGYTHMGWDTDKDTTSSSDYAKNATYTMGMADAKLYAIFSKDYVITWHYYDAVTSAEKTSTSTFTLYNNQTSAAVKTPSIASVTRDGVTYTGRGWSTGTAANVSSPTAAGNNVTVSGNCDYYASYSANITATFYYCVYESAKYNFNSTAQTATATATRYMNYTGTYVESNYTIPANVTAATVTIDGKEYKQGMEGTTTYNGLSTSAGSTTVMTGTPTTATTKYYAVYSVPVNFTYYNGTNVVKETKTRYATCNSSSKYVPGVPGEPTPTNYDGSTRFVRSNGYNWATTTTITSLTNDIANTFSSTSRATTMTAGTNFYALYQKDAVIAYNKNAGSDSVSNMPANATKTAYYVCTAAGTPASVIKPFNNTNTVSNATPIPAREGYAFMGWNTSNSATEAQYTGGETLTLTSASNIGTTTLYAVWYNIKPAQEKYDNRTVYAQEAYDVVIGVDSNNNQVVDKTEKAYVYDNDMYTTYVTNYTAYINAKTGATTIAGSKTLIEKAKTLEETAYPTAGKVVDKYYNNFAIDGNVNDLHDLSEINLNKYKTAQLENASDALDEGEAAKGKDATAANQKAMNDAVAKMATAYKTQGQVEAEPTFSVYETTDAIKNSGLNMGNITGINNVIVDPYDHTYYMYTNVKKPNVVIAVDEIAGTDNRLCYPTTVETTGSKKISVAMNGTAVSDSEVSEYFDVDKKTADSSNRYKAYLDKGIGDGLGADYYNKKAVITLNPTLSEARDEVAYTFSAHDDSLNEVRANEAALKSGNDLVYKTASVTDGIDSTEETINIVICYKAADGFDVTWDQWGGEGGHDYYLNQFHLYRTSGGANNWEIPGWDEDSLWDKEENASAADKSYESINKPINCYAINDSVYGDLNYCSFTYTFKVGSNSTANCTISAATLDAVHAFFNTAGNFAAAQSKGFEGKNVGGSGLGFIAWSGNDSWSFNYYPASRAYTYVHLIDRWGNVCEKIIHLPALDYSPASATASAGSVEIVEDGGSGIDTLSISAPTFTIIADEESELNGNAFRTSGNTVKVYTGEPNKSYTLTTGDNAGNSTTVKVVSDSEGYITITVDDLAYSYDGGYTFILNDYEITLYDGVVRYIKSVEDVVTPGSDDLNSDIVTTDDVSEIRVTDEHGEVFTITEYTDNGDGTRTWVMEYEKYEMALGEHSFTVEAKVGNDWYDEGITAKLTVNKDPDEYYPTGTIIDVNCEYVLGQNKTVNVKVADRASMIQFIELDHGSGTGTRSFDRYNDNVTIVSYNRKGEVVSNTSKDLAYEIWTINAVLADGRIGIRAKTSGSPVWEEAEDEYIFNHTYANANSELKYASLAAESGRKGAVGFTVVTGNDVISIQLKNQEGETVTVPASKATANDDFTLTFTGKVWFHGTGTRTASVRILDAYGWHDAGTLTYEINQ